MYKYLKKKICITLFSLISMGTVISQPALAEGDSTIVELKSYYTNKEIIDILKMAGFEYIKQDGKNIAFSYGDIKFLIINPASKGAPITFSSAIETSKEFSLEKFNHWKSVTSASLPSTVLVGKNAMSITYVPFSTRGYDAQSIIESAYYIAVSTRMIAEDKSEFEN